MKGFTLLEAVVSVSIVIAIAAILFSAFAVFRESNDLQAAGETIVGILKDARSRAIGSQDKTTYGVHFETAKVVLFKGSVYSSSNSANEVYILPAPVEISAISLTGGAVDTVFSILGGTTTTSGTVTLRSKRNTSKTRVITIFSTGNVQ
ncbi:hypothetical protein A3G55_01400 [Candidatus Giovannonibacteria bacterium RIFCSPLOWO2_12_FULL_44_25]|uniref:General secretion pathway GspH domain-containing protein n=1 Tax=Candidatus Giovannonibacteria bacterium RIFCSPHIGHO2_02_FULL_45_40 TaxID=1798337 RepID=A0A1F5W933_9BACT|nr:MAG: hypothetical protein A2120_03235 [Candidatus Giovannonibacteria bacterium GWA2_45_15]OGF59772.1 MAG: hypothetical protein A2W40_01525 [Candidatus Giovannonibacteria bacterium RIFCSPHIGHO2_01_45_12]OGF60978.1 MAG: hypothetical protein A2656_01850 [Candidatus Giovannonibacteria bacterium RIFCSPHIGHO2_01_FULL_44_100]OGF72153.1 MAG: hypothetical protein A3C05_02920 [Candidatus Giovannonibacteria bacterium RIFCSPHIGHO2_02_FULL_45_40]OGF84544.1 MAG: hypothetical protein A3A19_00235 [Candidatu